VIIAFLIISLGFTTLANIQLPSLTVPPRFTEGKGLTGLYALGMGAGFIAVSVLTASARDLMLNRISGLTPKIHKPSGLAIIVFGIYLLCQDLALYGI